MIELVVVVLVIGILAAAAAGRFTELASDSDRIAIEFSLESIHRAKELNSPESHPASIPAEWFRGGKLPSHPHNQFGVASIQVDATVGKTHPSWKVLSSTVSGCFWYNPTNGIVRARVGQIGSHSQTLALYNLINDSNETSLGNYSSGAGGS